jgi:hypothetical protein
MAVAVLSIREENLSTTVVGVAVPRCEPDADLVWRVRHFPNVRERTEWLGEGWRDDIPRNRRRHRRHDSAALRKRIR